MAADALARRSQPLQYRAACSMGGWVWLPPSCRKWTLEHPGGHVASWVALCSFSAPDLAARAASLRPASTRWEDAHGNEPEATSWFGVQRQLSFLGGRDMTTKIRGHRELCLCLIWQPDVLDWTGQWGDYQMLCGGGDVICEIVVLPADTSGLAVKNVSCP